MRRVPMHDAVSRGRTAAVSVLTAALLVACGSHGARAVQVGAGDSGSQIRLHVGDTLALDVGGGLSRTWALMTYPHSLMALTGADRRKGLFRLLARRAGGGRIVASVLDHCGPPALRGPECPVRPPMAGGGPLGGAFVLAVRIVE